MKTVWEKSCRAQRKYCVPLRLSPSEAKNKDIAAADVWSKVTTTKLHEEQEICVLVPSTVVNVAVNLKKESVLRELNLADPNSTTS